MSYEIELVQRGGRWEIASLSGAPALEPTDGDRGPPSTVDAPAEPSSTSIAPTPGA